MMQALLHRAGVPPGEAEPFVGWGREPSAGRGIQLADRGLDGPSEAWREEAAQVLALVARSDSPEDLADRLFPTMVEDVAACLLDLPAVVHGLLQRWEEALDERRDEHGRWRLEWSFLGADERLAGRPAADWIARAAGIALRRATGRDWPEPAPWGGARWGVALTFDIDSAGMYARGGWARSVRRLGAEQGAGAALRGAVEGALVNARLRRDPHDNLEALARRIDREGVRCTFFVQALRASRWDNYDLRREARLVRAMRSLRARGHEIGLHGSYATAERDAGFLRRQRRVVRELVGGPVALHRHHYLRTTGPENAALYRAAGFAADCTPGFSEREGFRLGTAFPVECDGVTIVPVHVMDVTLRHHRKLGTEEAFDAATRVLEEVRHVGGLGVLLWHPHNLESRLWRGWEEMPFELVGWARERGAGIGTIGEISQR